MTSTGVEFRPVFIVPGNRFDRSVLINWYSFSSTRYWSILVSAESIFETSGNISSNTLSVGCRSCNIGGAFELDFWCENLTFTKEAFRLSIVNVPQCAFRTRNYSSMVRRDAQAYHQMVG
jgi:hypothetical protein